MASRTAELTMVAALGESRLSFGINFLSAWVALASFGCSPYEPMQPQVTAPVMTTSPAANTVAVPPAMAPTNVASAGAMAGPIAPVVMPMNPIQTPPPSETMMPAAGGMGAAPGAMAGAGGMKVKMPIVEPEYKDGPLAGTCPDGFTPRSGMNSGFKSDDKMREFLVYLPNDMSSPRPVFVGITGTEQASDNFITSGGLTALTRMGWIVLAPIRLCTTEGRQQECLNGMGQSTMQGWVWEPWNDGSQQDKWNTDAGQDVRFLENMVRCVAKQWPVDQRRMYLGGISAGGSFTNRNLSFNSKFWAGGVPASGMWYIAAGNDSVNKSNQDQLMDGYCCPRPATDIQMYSSIVIVLFGGQNDQYTTRGDMPVTVRYMSEAQASSNVYDAQPNVAVVTCQGTQGHLWPRDSVWDPWMAMTLASHPKGTPKAAFKLPTPPAGYTCSLGRYKNLYQ